MLELKVIIASTRPGRVGPSVAQWFHEVAAARADLRSELIDLAEVALPMFDEPRHPSLGLYQHEHTRRWSARIAPSDAVAIVTPEYNHGPPPPLVNALDYLHKEWSYKPVGFVGYGGISGGARAIEITRQIVVALKMVPIMASVPIPFVARQLQEGRFVPTEPQIKSATGMLDELARVGAALKPLRG